MSDAKNCTFTFKKRKGGAGLRQGNRKESRPEAGGSSSDDETVVTRSERKTSDKSSGLLSAKTKSFKRPRQDAYDDSEEEKPPSVMVAYQSKREVESSTPRDMLATSEVQIDTEIDKDARAIFEKSLKVNQELKGKADDKIYRGMANYAQYYEKKDTAQGNAASANVRKGPMRAPANVRATVRWDYQPDLCKDYKETGFCGFGDSCKFLHDRSDYKFGWQLEREEHGKGDGPEDMSKYEIHSDEEDLPFKCFICRDSFVNPVVTKCDHYFCERCALSHYKKSQRCFVCSKQTFGVFNPAKKLIERLRLDEENRIQRADADSDEEAFVEINQPSGASAAQEEPVTEIEHLKYDDPSTNTQNADSDSDDDSE
nr:EOG090X09Q6 [Sida crystallina]